MKALSYLSRLFMVAVIAVCMIASYQMVDPILHRSTISLVIFNFLFFPLFIKLEFTTFKTIFLITIGNLIGLFSNFVFYYFSILGTTHLGIAFDGFYNWIYPFLNLVWILPFWSLSLSFLPQHSGSLYRKIKN